MTRTALLIGSPYDGLQGVGHDLRAMRKALAARGFTVRLCEPEQATRAGILAAYDDLIAGAEPGDAIVVYYSGHGGSSQPPGAERYQPHRDLQYIVPMDYGESTAGDFRGIASAELSARQLLLTDVTHNVTVILDCCHSGLMSRDPGLRLKAVDPAPYAWVRAHLDRLERDGLRTDLLPVESNELAVRVVACGPDQRAYEQPGATGTWRGVLTSALVRALNAAGDRPVTWSGLLDQVRHRVIGLAAGQRPEAEGPASRLLFTLEEAGLIHSLPVTPLGPPGRVRLDGAALLRVQAGDEFMIMPPGAAGADRRHRVGDLTVADVPDMSAEGTVVLAPGQSSIPIGAQAFRTRVTAPRIAVRVPDGATAVARAVEEAALARPAEPGEQWAVAVRDDDDGVTLCDGIGPLHPPYAQDARGLADLTLAVKVFAQATQLRQLAGDPAFSLESRVTVEWGLVVDGTEQPLRTEGEVLRPGQRIYVTARNEGPLPAYLNLLDIGLSGRITLLLPGTPSGRLLPVRSSHTVGHNNASGKLTGLGLNWPAGLDAAYARTETILVVLTSEPQDLSALQQPGIVQTRTAGSCSRLRDIIDQLATGRSRDIEPDTTSGVRYDIRAIDFDMTPVRDDVRSVLP